MLPQTRLLGLIECRQKLVKSPQFWHRVYGDFQNVLDIILFV